MAQLPSEPLLKKEDFILLSEFAEIRHGPQPICTIPERGEGDFDITSFSVRVFSTDFQQGQSEEFSISPDSQVLLTEPKDKLFAYVHYFALNDIEARGYLRQYCLSYLTSSPSKLIDHFQRLKQDFSQVTSFFKCGNHSIFKEDIDRRLLDLKFSIDEIEKKENILPHEEEEERDEQPPPYYDIYSEDIPEGNKDVLEKDTLFTQNLRTLIQNEMDSKRNQIYHDLINSQDTPIPTTTTTVNTVVRSEGNSLFYTRGSFTQDKGPYKPKRIMAHLSQRFTRQQRSLEQLSSNGHSLAMNRLNELHKKYSKSETALSMELLETELLSPLSSLLSIGRVPIINMFETPPITPPTSHTPPPPLIGTTTCTHLHHTCTNYKLMSSQDHESMCNIGGGVGGDKVGMNSTELLNTSDCSKIMMYLDIAPRERVVSIIDPLGTPHNSSGLFSPDPRLPHPPQEGGEKSSSYNTPEQIPTPPSEVREPYTTPPLINPNEIAEKLIATNFDDEKESDSMRGRSRSSNVIVKNLISSERNFSRSLPHLYSIVKPRPHVPANLRLNSHTTDSSTFFTPMVTCPLSHHFEEGEENKSLTKNGLPFISSVDLVETSSQYKPGKDLVTLFKDVPELRDILYCLLVGRPLVIIASPRDEKLVRKHIRALWLFVSGYRRHYQVIPWQEQAFDLHQMMSVKLIGIMCPTFDRSPPIPNHLKNHVSYWDWTTNTLSVPTYTGSLLNPILTRSKDKKNEELFLVLIESILLELSLKCFVYYHGYCLKSEMSISKQLPSPVEASPRKVHAVMVTKKDKVQFLSKLLIKEGDIEIVEYFTRIIKEQQLSELNSIRPSYSDRPEKLILKGYHCQERVCKPKRPS